MLSTLKRLVSPRKRLRREIEEYADRLASGQPLALEEVARFHLAKLQLSDDPEVRLRSLETLAALDRPEALPLILRHLVEVSHDPRRTFDARQVGTAAAILRSAILGPLEDDVAFLLTSQSFGLDVSEARTERYIPVRVFSSSVWERGADEIARCAWDYANIIGIDLAYGSPALETSWFKRWMGRTREALSRDEVSQRLRKAERALELAVLQKEQANVDRQQAEAAARLIESLSQVPNASCQIGSLLVAKISDECGTRVLTRTLTQDEMLLLERNTDLLKEPGKLMDRLRESRHTETGAPAARPKLVSAPEEEVDQ